MKICVAGKNDIAINSLNYLINNLNVKRENILAILNKNDEGIDGYEIRAYKEVTE